MKESIRYFFGQGTEVEFSLFTIAHFAPILLMVAVIFLIHVYRTRIAGLDQMAQAPDA